MTSETLMPMIGGPRHGVWHDRAPDGARVTVPKAAWAPVAGLVQSILHPLSSERLAVVEEYYVSRVYAMGMRRLPVWLHESLDVPVGQQPNMADHRLLDNLVLDVLFEHAGGEVHRG